jgi:hypothetical protein
MRIVIIAKSKRHTRIYYYFKRAFKKLGHNVLWIKYSKLKSYLGETATTAISEKLLSLYKPGLLFFHGRDLPFNLLLYAKKKMPVVMYYDDCIRDSKGSEDSQDEVFKFGRKATRMYITNRGEIPTYKAKGVKASFITGGCDPVAHRVVKNPAKFYHSEVAFIGKPNTPERVACMREIAKRFDLKLWGGGWGKIGLKAAAKDAYASDYRKICAGAKIILGWNIDPTVDLYFSNRTWYTLGCGGFLLTLYSPSLEELFERGVQLDWFESTQECCAKIEYYLQHPKERRKIARAGFELAHNEYSYEKMAQQIVSDLQEGPRGGELVLPADSEKTE